MSSSKKARRLPEWAAPVSKQKSQSTAKESESEQEENGVPEDVFEPVDRHRAADVPEGTANRGAKRPGEDFSTLLEGVVFTISGLMNPERAELRQMALDMGAQYRPSWSGDSTLLVCAFANTPTFNQVQAMGGTIVDKDWISMSFKQRGLVPVEKYLLHVGKPWRTVSNSVGSGDFGVASDLLVPESHKNGRHESPVPGYKTEPGTRKLKEREHATPYEVGENQMVGGLTNFASPETVRRWVLEDLGASLTWLEQQDDKPDDHELEAVATQGLLVCLDDAVKSLQENKGLSMVMDNWAFIPRAVRQLLVYEENGQCARDELVSEGARLKIIYGSELKKLGFNVALPGGGEPTAAKPAEDENKALVQSLRSHPSWEEEKDEDDDATEIISDTDSRDPADFDTDDTEELDEEEVAECKEKILQTFGLDN